MTWHCLYFHGVKYVCAMCQLCIKAIRNLGQWMCTRNHSNIIVLGHILWGIWSDSVGHHFCFGEQLHFFRHSCHVSPWRYHTKSYISDDTNASIHHTPHTIHHTPYTITQNRVQFLLEVRTLRPERTKLTLHTAERRYNDIQQQW